jgi:hypothetical protein
MFQVLGLSLQGDFAEIYWQIHLQTMNEMKERARKNDVSIYITRQDVIDLLNKLES